MRLLVVIPSFTSPTRPHAGVFALRQAHALERIGHDVEVVELGPEGRTRLANGLRFARMALRVHRAARGQRVDTAIIHHLRWSNRLPAWALRTAGVPYVAIGHGSDVRALAHDASTRTRTAPLLEQALAVVVVSDELRDLIRKARPGADPRVIPMGVEMPVGPTPRSHPPAEPVFLAIGALDRNKNVEFAADCIAAYRRQHGRGELWFAGDGPLRGTLAGRDGVRLLGSVPPDQVGSLIERVSAGLHVSLQEGFPVAPLEFIAHGVPLVSTPNAVSVEMPAEAGIVVPLDDVSAAVAAMGRALGLPRASASALDYARSRSADAMATELADVIAHRLKASGTR